MVLSLPALDTACRWTKLLLQSVHKTHYIPSPSASNLCTGHAHRTNKHGDLHSAGPSLSTVSNNEDNLQQMSLLRQVITPNALITNQIYEAKNTQQ